MFERFTDRARRVVVLAQEEARLLNHNYIGTEHLLLGLVREGEGVAARALGRLGVSREDVRARVEGIIGQGGSAPSGHIPFTPRAKKVLELSLREALQLGHNYIGTEHILLGLVREGEGVAAQVLGQLDLDLSRVRQEVVQLLSGYAPPPPGTPPRTSDTPAVVRARQAARRRAGEHAVGTHHVLSAIVADPDSLGARALAALGVTPETLEAQLARLDPVGTSDELPEEAGARQTTVEIIGDRVAVVVDDEELRRRLVDALPSGTDVVRSDDPAAASFPELWQDVTRHLADVVARLEREAAGRWRPPEWEHGWDVAAYVVIAQGPAGMKGTLEVAEGIDRDEARARIAEWLTDHQPKGDATASYLTVVARTAEGGQWTYQLSSGLRPDSPRTQLQLLVAHAIVDLAPPRAQNF